MSDSSKNLKTRESAQGDEADAAVSSGPLVPPHPVLRYTTFRLAFFFVALVLLLLCRKVGLLPLAGSAGLLSLMFIAVLVSGLVSYVVLNRHRDAMSAAIVNRVQRTKENMVASASGEDEAPDLAPEAFTEPEPLSEPERPSEPERSSESGAAPGTKPKAASKASRAPTSEGGA